MIRLSALLFAFLILPAVAAEPQWVYIENQSFRLGIRKDAGACIGYLSRKGGPNVLNSHDHGRFVQQSYYGAPDGSFWGKQPWRYNPVQGGDYKGHPAKLLALKHEAAELYSKTQPKHWANGADISEMTMEQWIKLDDEVVHLRFRMQYTGEKEHPARHQEIPAVFIEPEYRTLVVHDGSSLRSWEPGWPNEYVKLADGVAMFLRSDGQGVGVFVPTAREATCYRFGKEGDRSACSYVAPIATFALTPGMTFSYDAWLTIGTQEEIRARFEKVRKRRTASPSPEIPPKN